MTSTRRAAVACFVAVLATAAHAQDRITEEALLALQARALAHPTDTAVQCNYGWAAYVRHIPGAGDILDHAVSLLGEPTEPALRRRLGACLYSRGRAAESETSVAAAIPFYERSVSLRANASVQARLDGARRFVAARWTQTDPIVAGRESPPMPDALARALGRSAALLVTRFVDAAGDEIAIVDDGDIVVAAHGASGAWAQVTAWEMSDDRGGVSAWLEAPLEGEMARVVVLEVHEHMPDWATLAVDDAGAVEVVRVDDVE